MATVPTVQMYMARVLHTIEAGEPLSSAEKAMAEHGIRHLPVMRDGKVAGILSDRDVKLAGSVMGASAAKLPVIDVCNEAPYTVDSDTPLADVVSTMAEKHFGSVLVLDGERLAGIFTTVDACRVLSDLIRVKF